MHLLAAYSSTTRLRYTRPKLFPQFVPLPFSNKYIVACCSSGMSGKNFAYWEEVLDILKPHIPEYKIIQTGGKDDIKPNGIDLNLCGQTNFYELCYLAQNATLCLSGDTSLVHLADSFNTSLIALYGLTDPRISGGYFNELNNQVYLEPDRTKFPPTFNPNDSSVNNIKPEEVARAVLKQLGKDKDLVKHTTYHFGNQFFTQILEVIPDVVLHPQQFQSNLINIRADYHFDENGIYQNAANYKSVIVTPKSLNVDILKQIKQNIVKLVYIIDESHSLDFVKALRKAGIPYELISYMEQDKINELKFDYCDYGIIFKRTIDEAPDWLKEIKQPLKFKTDRYITAKSGMFPSVWHWKNNLSFSLENNIANVPDDLSIDWARDLSYYWVYNDA